MLTLLKHFRKTWVIAPQRHEEGRYQAYSLYLMCGSSLENLSPPSWEPKSGRAVSVEEEQDFISASPCSNCYLVPHLWPLKVWLFSAALLFSPTCNSVDILPKKLNITQAVTDRAQLSQAAEGVEDKKVQETWLLLLQVVENKHGWAPEKGLFFSHLQYWMGWGKFKSNNLVAALLPPGAKRWLKWKKQLGEKEKAEKNQERAGWQQCGMSINMWLLPTFPDMLSTKV